MRGGPIANKITFTAVLFPKWPQTSDGVGCVVFFSSARRVQRSHPRIVAVSQGTIMMRMATREILKTTR